jgi:glycosyltransferase involved in cell wall biosynthesis
MALTVLNVSYPLAPVSDSTAGGAEQVLGILDWALVHAGHRSLVLASEDSSCYGLLIPTPAADTILDEAARHQARREHQSALGRALEHYAVDVVHLHGLDFFEYLPEPGVPVVVTLHLPPSWYPKEVFQIERPDTHLVCVSESQRRACPSEAKIVAVIENGVRLDRFGPARKKGDYALGLGRICPEKAFHLALDAAARAGIACWLAGTVFAYPTHREYFAQFIRPRLRPGHRFLGAVGGRRKRALLAGAKCLLIPSQVPETSSLAAMEALACGTAVIAFRSGALEEIIDHGWTGFLVDDLQEMASAIAKAAAIDPLRARAQVAARFSADETARKYLELYHRVARGDRRRSKVTCLV